LNTKTTDKIQSLATPLMESESLSVKKEGESLSYSEIPGLTDPSLDVINQLSANMKVLNDLHLRLQFTFKEIKSVLHLK